jgi:hypothetical protein
VAARELADAIMALAEEHGFKNACCGVGHSGGGR